MTSSAFKILFFHGLDSSRESSKFHAIQHPHKYCVNVDYRQLSFQTVLDFYHKTIEKIQPQLIVGHSLGGYWALKMSALHDIPAVVANPSLAPQFREDYASINEQDLDHDTMQMAYLELGDEILDMYAVQQQLEPYMLVESIDGGHHRLANPENINVVIEHMQKYILQA